MTCSMRYIGVEATDIGLGPLTFAQSKNTLFVAFGTKEGSRLLLSSRNLLYGKGEFGGLAASTFYS